MSSLPDYKLKNLNDALYPLNECDDPDVDILFFHGVVLEDYEEMHKTTWMTRSGELCWPAAWLPREPELSRARMFSVKYDSSARKATDRGRFSMKPLVENLAANLLELNIESIGQKGIPVILVGHDLGGLVIKELCLYLVQEISLGKHKRRYGRYSSTSKSVVKYQKFLESLAGIFFFATPHQGLRFGADGIKLEGDLVTNLETLNADTAISNNNFRRLRQSRRWMARGEGPALEDTEGFLHVQEASMRYDTDEFLMVSETIRSITKPESQESSSFQFFKESMKEFIQEFHGLDLRAEGNDPLKGTVGLEGVVEEILLHLSRQQRTDAGTSAVVLHGMGGIGKSTLGKALYLTLKDKRKGFHKGCWCYLDRKITRDNPTPVTQLQSNLLESFLYTCSNSPKITNCSDKREVLMKCYREKQVMRMPLLIFLDNLEDEDELKYLLPGDIGKCLPRGSHVIVATRNSTLCSTLRLNMGLPKAMLYGMKELDASTGQRLLCMHAFSNGEVEIPLSRVPVPWKEVEEVNEACGGLPLALEVVGKYLRFDIEEGGEWRGKWRRAIKALKEWVSVKGTPPDEDLLLRCLEFSYNKLSTELQRTLLDIVFCFNGSPWRELLSMYDDDLNMLKRRSLIKEGTAMIAAGDETYQYVQVHSLLESLCRKRGKTSRSHFIKSMDGSNIDLQDIPSPQGLKRRRQNPRPKTFARGSAMVSSLDLPPDCGEDKVALVLEGRRPVPSLVSQASRYTNWILKFFYPEKQSVEAQSLPISHLARTIRTLRILILKNLRVEGTFADDNLPLHLECLVCFNSSVPFSKGNVANLRELKYVDFSNTIGNRTYKFGTGVRRLRLESPLVTTLGFEAGVCELEEFALVSGEEFQAYSPSCEFPSVRKLIIENVPRLKELPAAVFTMEALESISIHGCNQVTVLPNHLGSLSKLRCFYVSLQHLRRLPDTLCKSTSLQSLILEDCLSLAQLPSEIGGIRTLQVLGIKGCSTLTDLPGSLLTAFHLSSHSRFQLSYNHRGDGISVPSPEMWETATLCNLTRNKWLICSSKNNMEGKAQIIQEAATAAQMPSVMLKPTRASISELSQMQWRR